MSILAGESVVVDGAALPGGAVVAGSGRGGGEDEGSIEATEVGGTGDRAVAGKLVLVGEGELSAEDIDDVSSSSSKSESPDSSSASSSASSGSSWRRSICILSKSSCRNACLFLLLHSVLSTSPSATPRISDLNRIFVTRHRNNYVDL